MSGMTKDQIYDLLVNVLDSPKVNDWKGNKIQFCCTIHGESHPSCGITVDYCPPDEPNLHGQYFNCFACGEHGSIARLVQKSLPDRFKSVSQAAKFLKNRYGVNPAFMSSKDSLDLRRYEDKFIDLPEDREVKPIYELAPFKCGKETYQYFFDRGFDKSDMQEYKIGRSLQDETVIIPVFWEDNTLAGVIGRYIDPDRPKNERFKVYEFKKSHLIYPLNLVETVDDTLILMEACFDVMLLRKWGFPNAIATMTNKVSRKQADQIAQRCRKLIVLCDLDERGDKLLETAHKYLDGRVEIFTPTYAPRSGKDPGEWGEIETVKTINSATYRGVGTLPRL